MEELQNTISTAICRQAQLLRSMVAQPRGNHYVKCSLEALETQPTITRNQENHRAASVTTAQIRSRAREFWSLKNTVVNLNRIVSDLDQISLLDPRRSSVSE